MTSTDAQSSMPAQTELAAAPTQLIAGFPVLARYKCVCGPLEALHRLLVRCELQPQASLLPSELLPWSASAPAPSPRSDARCLAFPNKLPNTSPDSIGAQAGQD